MQRSPTSSAAGGRKARAAIGDGKRRVEPAKQVALRDEFLIAMDKFSAGIHRTIQQIEGEVCFVCDQEFLLKLSRLCVVYMLNVTMPCTWFTKHILYFYVNYIHQLYSTTR